MFSFIEWLPLASHCAEHFTGAMGIRVLNCAIIIFFPLHCLGSDLPEAIFCLGPAAGMQNFYSSSELRTTVEKEKDFVNVFGSQDW